MTGSRTCTAGSERRSCAYSCDPPPPQVARGVAERDCVCVFRPNQEVKHLISGTRYKVFSKDSSGKSVPKELLPAAYKTATCTIDAHLDKNAAWESKPRTINPSGRCTTGAKARTPKECAKSPTGARVGGKDVSSLALLPTTTGFPDVPEWLVVCQGWHWDRVSDVHPSSATWFACPVPGNSGADGHACITDRKDPDTVTSCGGLCSETEGCNFFWIFDNGRW